MNERIGCIKLLQMSGDVHPNPGPATKSSMYSQRHMSRRELQMHQML